MKIRYYEFTSHKIFQMSFLGYCVVISANEIAMVLDLGGHILRGARNTEAAVLLYRILYEIRWWVKRAKNHKIPVGTYTIQTVAKHYLRLSE